jgi:two-component system, NarL family, invasion response regulator UvrY
MKILIADDHMVVREGLKQVLRSLNKITLIDEASNGLEALAKIQKCKYDLIILDISMPCQTGLDILQTLKNRGEKANVLILSVHPEEQYALRALRLGASGYLSKGSAGAELLKAIDKISNGGKYISLNIAEKLAFDFNNQGDRSLHERLSDREFQIMCMLAKGISVLETADHLHISEKTVSTHRTHLLEKMGMKKNAELTLYAIKNNLIE